VPAKAWISSMTTYRRDENSRAWGTRAEERLYLSWAKRRTIYGKTLARHRPPFLADIEARLLRMEKTGAKAPKPAEPVQLDLFGG
jgi:DNA helicase II / ATP-dependent DNA helicase PcrA